MMELILFYGGIAAVAVAVIGAIIATILLRTAGKRLRKQLEEEYGEKR